MINIYKKKKNDKIKINKYNNSSNSQNEKKKKRKETQHKKKHTLFLCRIMPSSSNGE
jgi:hypothetical protein